MAPELPLTWVAAVAVPFGLVVEELLVRWRSAKARPVQMAPATGAKSMLGLVALLSELPRKAA